jgi:glutaconate CoA-transferase subunit B
VAEVREATGFTLEVAGDLHPPSPPSAAELAVLRSLDSLGIRRSEFDPAELAREFGAHTGQHCAC